MKGFNLTPDELEKAELRQRLADTNRMLRLSVAAYKKVNGRAFELENENYKLRNKLARRGETVSIPNGFAIRPIETMGRKTSRGLVHYG